MKYINKNTQEILTYNELKKAHKNVSLPRVSAENLLGDWYLIHLTPKPVPTTPLKEVVESTPIINDIGNYLQTWEEQDLFSGADKASLEADFLAKKLINDKTAQKAIIKTAYLKELSQGITTASTFKMDADITLLKAGYDLAVSLNETSMLVRDFDNVSHDLALADVELLISEVTLAYRALWLKKVEMQDAIDAELTAEEVLNVVW